MPYILISLISFIAVFSASVSRAAPESFTFQGQIIQPSGQALEGTNVQFTIELLAPGLPDNTPCVLYSEEHTLNMQNSNGVFSVEVGSGSGITSDYAGVTTIGDALGNGVTITAVTGGCVDYIPTLTDGRQLRLTFDDGTSGPITITQNHDIVSVPFAYSAASINGLTPADLLNRDTSGSNVLSQANLVWLFETARYTELQALINGTSTQYLSGSITADLSLGTNRITNLGAPTAGTDAANRDYVDQNIGGNTANIGTLGPGNDGQVLTWDGSAGQFVASLPTTIDATKLPLAGGTMTGPIDMGAQNITNGNNVTIGGNMIATGGISTSGTLAFYNASDYVGFQAGGAPTNQIWVLPDSDGTSGQVLTTDGSGNLAWSTASSPVTSVFSRTGAIVAQASDYTAIQIDNTPGGDIAASSVQGAINELDSEKVSVSGDNMTGSLTMDTENEIRFADNAGGEYVGLKAPNTVPSSFVWDLPASDGTSGQALVTNGSGALSFTSVLTSETQDMDDVYNEGSVVTVDTTDVVYNITGGNNFQVQDAGTTSFVVNGSGNVGIGVPVPGAQLHIANAGATSMVVQDTTNLHFSQIGSQQMAIYKERGNTSGDPGLYIFSYIDGGATSQVGSLAWDDEGGEGLILMNNNNPIGPRKISLKNAVSVGAGYSSNAPPSQGLIVEGNTGIGTTTPSGRLDVEGGDVFIGTGTLTNASGSEDLSVTGNIEVDGTIYGSFVGDGSGLTGVVAAESQTMDDTYNQGSSVTVDATDIIFDLTGSNTFQVQDGGAPGLIVDGSGNVGLGTNTPLERAHITDGNLLIGTPLSNTANGLLIQNENLTVDKKTQLRYNNDTFYISGLTGNQSMYIGRNYGSTGSAYGQMNFDINSNFSPSAFRFLVDNDVKFLINETGNVGIGTSTPTRFVSIHQTANDSAALSLETPGTSGNQTAQLELHSQADGNILGASAGNKGWQVFSRGNAFSTAGQRNDFGIVYWDGSSWTNAFSIDSISGNVGIGTLTPVGKLDVDGEILMQGATSGYSGFRAPATAGDNIWTLPASDGTSGQVLSTDGSGNLSWATAAGGSGDFLANGSIAMTGDLELVNGSAATPALRFASDLDTGLFSMSPDSIGLSANGINRLGINSIAVSPYVPVRTQNGTQGSPSYSFASSTSTGMFSPAANELAFSNNNSESIRIDASGYVGIGTNNPRSTLNIFDDLPSVHLTTDGLNHGTTQLGGAPSTSLLLSGGGSTTGGGNLLGMSGNSTIPGLTLIGMSDSPSSSTGAVRILGFKTGGPFGSPLASDDLVLSAGGLLGDVFTLQADGNVGIGTSSAPNAMLDVNGDIHMRGATSGYAGFQAPATAGNNVWTLPASDGTSGQVLSTDGSGNLSWVTASGGGGDLLNGGNSGAVVVGSNDNTLSLEAGGANAVTILGNGNVGVGTTNPGNPFVVSQNSTLISTFESRQNNGANFMFLNTLGDSSSSSIMFSKGGTIQGSISYAQAASDADETLNLTAGSSGRIRIEGNGSVGIGTTDANGALDVAGDIRMLGSTSGYAGFQAPATAGNNVWTLPTGDGTSGQVLQTDGSGNLSWATATGGSGDLLNGGNSGAVVVGSNDNTLELEANGSTAMTINASGNVGIGQFNPEVALQISNPAGGVDDYISIERGTTDWRIWASDSETGTPSLRIGGTTVSRYAWQFDWAGATANIFKAPNDNPAQDVVNIRGATSQTGDFFNITTNGGLAGDILTVNASGHVGVGTTTPGNTLTLGSGGIAFRDPGINHGMTLWASETNRGGNISTGSNGGLSIGGFADSTTSDGIRLSGTSNNPTSTTPSIRLWTLKKAGTSAGILADGDLALAVTNLATDIFGIRGNGDTGIGTNAPGAKLDVAGDLRLRGATSGYIGLQAPATAGNNVWTLPAADGTSGQVLSTDGSGNLSWIAGGGGSGDLLNGGNSGAVVVGSNDNTLELEANGSTAMTIDTSGYVGIGTDSPTAPLTVHAPDIGAYNSIFHGLVPTMGVNDEAYFAIGREGATNNWASIGFNYAGDNDPENRINFGFYGDGDKMVLNAAGELGIGTNNPGSVLHVESNSTSSPVRVTRSSNPGERLGVSFVPNGALNASNVSWNFGVPPNESGFKVQAWDGSTLSDWMTVTPAGNVGIGQNNPTGKLDVDGDIRLRGSASGYAGLQSPAVGPNLVWTLPTADGTSGQVLSTDGSGNLSWVTASGGADNLGNHTATTELDLDGYGIRDVDAGNASFPSLSFLNDINTGLFSPGADTFGLVTGGAERIRIDASGNIGVGTTSPSSTLEIFKNVDSETKLSLRNTNTSINANVRLELETDDGSVGALQAYGSGSVFNHLENRLILSSYNSATGLDLMAGTGDDIRFYTNGFLPTDEKMRIDASGHVGIGTSSPQGTLDLFEPSGEPPRLILRNGALNHGITAFTDVSTDTALQISTNDTGNGGAFFTAFANAPTYSAYQFIGLLNNPNASTPAFNFVSFKKNGVAFDNLAASETVFEYRNGLTADPVIAGLGNGNIGIGTDTPGGKLDVDGDIRMRGSTSGYAGFQAPATAGNNVWTLPTADGASGQVLSTDGSGNLSWVAGGGGGSFDPAAVDSNITPDADTTYDLGTSLLKWNQIHGSEYYVGFGIYFANAAGGELDMDDSVIYGDPTGVRFGDHPIPTVNNNTDLGSSSLRWRNVYSQDYNVGFAINFESGAGGELDMDDSVIYGDPTGVRFGDHPIPTVNNNTDLGSSSLRWRNVYSQDYNVNNGIYFENGAGGELDMDDSVIYGDPTGVRFGDHPIPTVNNNIDLGSASRNWRTIYAVDGTFGGMVGIGTSTPSDILHVVGDARVGDGGTNGCLKRADGGTLTGTCSSDARLKKKIQPMESVVDRFARLSPSTYYWRADEFPNKHFGDTQQLGLIAQELQEVFPDLVVEDKDGYLKVNYTDLNMYFMKAFIEHYNQWITFKIAQQNKDQEQDRNISSVQERLNEKDQEINDLKGRVKQLENLVKQLIEDKK